ncbi:MAG TPA: hypothetical protein VJ751_05310 [Pyrinomonadaceae bacterium]|nr:hypothetical protein [Pyrinomonadaceae bacterium]
MRTAILTLILCAATALSGSTSHYSQTPMGGDIVANCEVEAYVIDPGTLCSNSLTHKHRWVAISSRTVTSRLM